MIKFIISGYFLLLYSCTVYKYNDSIFCDVNRQDINNTFFPKIENGVCLVRYNGNITEELNLEENGSSYTCVYKINGKISKSKTIEITDDIISKIYDQRSQIKNDMYTQVCDQNSNHIQMDSIYSVKNGKPYFLYLSSFTTLNFDDNSKNIIGNTNLIFLEKVYDLFKRMRENR